MTTVEGVAELSLDRFHKCLEEGKPVSALGHLLIIVNLEPTLKAELCPVLLSLVGSLSISLAAEHRYDDLLKCYEEILGVYGDNEVVLNNIGSQLYRFSHLKESRSYFQKACAVNPSYLPAFRNLQNVTNVLVERWHFRMLNDAVRNNTFRAAINKRAGEAAAIDIGTGTGLLSLYLKSSGVDYVCACDYSSVMTSIAQQVFDANLPLNSVLMVNKLSTDMRVPTDIPFKCSLVVSETMDSGLLGEHLLSTLDHAWDHLLLAPSPTMLRVIPSKATVFGTPIQSIKIARKNRLLPPVRLPARCPEQLDWSGLSVRQIKSEPYDTENLYTDSDCQYLSEPKELFSFNFNDPTEIKQRLRSEIDKSVKLSFTQSGFVDAVAVWFDAHLDDQLKITTSPLSDNHCSSWHHAIFPCDSNAVVAGTDAVLVAKCDRGVLHVKMNFDTTSDQSVVALDEPVIRFLNSTSYELALNEAIARISNILPVNRVVDASLFPNAGLLLTKNTQAKLLAINDLPIHLIKKLIKRNKIKSELVSRKTSYDLDRASCLPLEEKYDLFIVNFIESRGEISQDFLKIAEAVVRKFLKPNGVIIPQKTEIWGQLVNSPHLVNENRVTNPQLNDEFVLSEFINEYRVSTHLDVNMKEVEFEPLSSPFLIASIPTERIYSRENQSWEVKVDCIRDGQLQAIFYWFDTILLDDVKFSSSSEDSFVSQAAEVLPSDVPVFASDTVILNCLYSYGVIKLDVA